MKSTKNPMLIVFVLSILFIVGCKEESSDDNSKDAAVEPFFITQFHMKSSAIVKNTGNEITSQQFTSTDWHPVSVPTTVLRGLIANNVYPDPYVGLNNMLIPDAYAPFNDAYDLAKYSHLPNQQNPWLDPYWFRSTFTLPANFNGRQIWLTLNGINYRADIWLNGQKISTADTTVGMFEKFRFNVTDHASPGEENIIAFAIHPLDYPGEPSAPQLTPLDSFGANCGLTSEIGKNVTMQSAVGWDWIPAVRDRNMGIWQDVYFTATAPVDIRHSFVVTDLPLPDTSSAALSIETTLVNPVDQPINGLLRILIEPYNFTGDSILVEKEISVPAEAQTVASLTYTEFPALQLTNPALWWPNQYGEQNLYSMQVSYLVDGIASDHDKIKFGIKEVHSEVFYETAQSVGRRFYVNGVHIQLRGGSWVPDLLLNRDRDRYEKELRFSKSANLNTVRIWGGGVTPPEDFFDVCDELGLLVWHDFWITGDCNGTWDKGTQDWPLDGELFLSNARSVVYRLRHHASMLVWAGGNEGYPRKEIYQPLRDEILATLDGTHPFLPSTGVHAPPGDTWDLSWPDDEPAGVYSGGPY